MHCEKQQSTTDNLDGIADEHNPSFRHGISKGTDKRSKNDVKQNENKLEQRNQKCRRMQINQQSNRHNQQRIICEGGEKLRSHNRIETAIQNIPLGVVMF